MDSVSTNPYSTPFIFNLPNHKTCFPNYYHFPVSKSSHFNKIRTSSISVASKHHSNHHETSSQCPTYSPFSALAPILKRIKHIAAKASTNQLHSVLPDEFDGKLMQSGAFGTALLSITSTAKVRISPFVATLAANPTFVSGFFAWAIAQSMKVFLHFYFERKWDFRIICASGGMPSSHTALCTALTTSVAICHGVADSLFPVCLGFSLIVMYDAIGVRRHAGMQAEVLNVIVEDLFKGHPISERKLKELLGHTPSQVVAGALLGIVVACFCCQACLVPF